MDFPAAHSMDTMWFAVDADGHVAAFDSGEGGGVPELAFCDVHYELRELLLELPNTGSVLDPAGHELGAGAQHATIGERGPTHLIAFLHELEPVADLIARLSGKVVPATTGVAVELEVGDRAAFDELHRRGACRSCHWQWSDGDSELAAHGVYHYKCGEAFAAPYMRIDVPAQPLVIGDAPPGVRGHAIKFAGHFADTLQLQPAEHWRSQGWSAGWLSSDGKTVRPFPDRQREFEDEVASYDDEYAVDRSVLDRPEGELAAPGEKHVPPPKAEVASPKKPWWKLW